MTDYADERRAGIERSMRDGDEARIAALTAERDALRAKVEAAERNAARWYGVWEWSLEICRLDDEWWCVRTDYLGNRIEYPRCSSRDAAIDAARKAEEGQA